MWKKIIGCILILIGTAVGAGMLALPVVTAHANIQTTMFVMIVVWLMTIISTLAMLEVNLWFKPGANLLSMTQYTLGPYFKQFTCFVYLLLFYSVISAYLSAGGDVLHSLLGAIHINLPSWARILLALLLLGSIVARGIGTVDIVNRGLMSVKLLSYFILVIAVLPHISLNYLSFGRYTCNTSMIMVIVLAFGFALIIPTLRSYLNSHIASLKAVIIWGTSIILVIYLLWVICVQGLLPREGSNGLLAILKAKDTSSLLMDNISLLIHSSFLSIFVKIFISICTVTSFLGVAISLTDFIADGLQYEKKGLEGIIVYGLTFLPPFLVVLYDPGIFIKALSFGGICCVYIFLVLPLMMLYRGRYHQTYSQGKTLLVPGGKSVVIITGLIAIGLFVLQIPELIKSLMQLL